MSRVQPRGDISGLGLDMLFQKGKEIMGFETMDGLIMSHQPEMLRSFAQMIMSILKGGTIDPGLKRLIGYVCSTASGCTYCTAHTNYTAQFYNVDESKMKAVWTFESSELFSDAEKAALHLARQTSVYTNQSTEQDFERLRRYYNEEAIVEIVFTISLYAFLNRFNSTMKTDIEDAPKAALDKLNDQI